MFNPRTDLAIETREIYKKANKLEDEIPGVTTEVERDENITVTKVQITSEKGERAINKPKGCYITIEAKDFRYADEDYKTKISNKITNTLKDMLENKVSKKEDVLVVGLGNLNVTPDALGPKVTENVEITRHILQYAPQYIDKDSRPVSAIAPGVLGTTGIETAEILKGIIEKTAPKAIIAIDALASRKMERISSTIQIADTRNTSSELVWGITENN